MPHATLIYNPLAGPADLATTLESIAGFWRVRGWQVETQPTQAAGHATELARIAAAAGHRLVLAAGGDGTLGEVTNGLAGTETIMAPLPMGTANSFAKELLMPRPHLFGEHNLLPAVESLAAGRVQSMDLGYTPSRDRYWLLWAGTGADGFLVSQLEPRPKWSKRIGPLGYAIQGLMVAPRLPEMKATVNVDGRIYQDYFVLTLVSNCRRYIGGEVILSPQAKLDDGLFEVWLLRGKSLAKVFLYIWLSWRGKHHNHPDMVMVNGRSITIHTEPTMPCQTDGDRAGSTPLTCEIKPGALRLLVPNTAPPDLFDQPGQNLE